jgi:PIN domain nuclease of toxin-antitoxin system
MVLLDTHVVVWLAKDSQRIGKAAVEAIAADRDRMASAMVSWEIAMQIDKKRFTIDIPLAEWLRITFDTIGMEEAPVTGEIGRVAGCLPAGIHGDPCDRIMIATAQVLDCPLLTADEKILDYAAAGHLQAIDARL